MPTTQRPALEIQREVQVLEARLADEKAKVEAEDYVIASMLSYPQSGASHVASARTANLQSREGVLQAIPSLDGPRGDGPRAIDEISEDAFSDSGPDLPDTNGPSTPAMTAGDLEAFLDGRWAEARPTFAFVSPMVDRDQGREVTWSSASGWLVAVHRIRDPLGGGAIQTCAACSR